MLTYSDLEAALKRVPLEQLPKMYELILAHAEWPFDASPAAMAAETTEVRVLAADGTVVEIGPATKNAVAAELIGMIDSRRWRAAASP